MRKLAALSALAALAACSVQGIQRPPDPYVNVDTARPVYKRLTLAVIRTKAMQANARATSAKFCYGDYYTPAKWFGQSYADLEKAFGRVIPVERPEDARSAGADLIAILDHGAQLYCARAVVDISLKAAFLTLDERQIDEISGSNWKSSPKTNSMTNPFAKGSGRLMWPRDMDEASDEAIYNFKGALFGSQKLQDFAARGDQSVAGDSFRASDVDELPDAAPAPRKAHAVVIGIENYRAGLPPASFAAADAKLTAKYLSKVVGFPDGEVVTLVDGAAGKSDFEKYFESWLPDRVAPGDEVFVFFSGHGAPNPETGDSYLVPYDGDPMYLSKTAYPLAKMYAALSKLPASKITVALDSCFSGAGGRSVIAAGARPLVTVKQASVPSKITVLAAASGEEISNTYKEKGHGLFTYYFLRGMKEHGGDWRADFDYLKPEVSRAARRDFNASQEPQWLGATR